MASVIDHGVNFDVRGHHVLGGSRSTLVPDRIRRRARGQLPYVDDGLLEVVELHWASSFGEEGSGLSNTEPGMFEVYRRG